VASVTDDDVVSLADAPARAMNMIEAINDALDIKLERDPDAVSYKQLTLPTTPYV
jgi:2-oxoisovalerate dehydrogenase E1 component beta subunit